MTALVVLALVAIGVIAGMVAAYCHADADMRTLEDELDRAHARVRDAEAHAARSERAAERERIRAENYRARLNDEVARRRNAEAHPSHCPERPTCAKNASLLQQLVTEAPEPIEAVEGKPGWLS